MSKRTLDISDGAYRKGIPLARGVLDYFPDALCEVARLSEIGNQKYNPGQDLHWSRNQGGDDADCIMRHLVQRGTFDDDGVLHSVKVAWRALALAQREIEVHYGLSLSRGSKIDHLVTDKAQ